MTDDCDDTNEQCTTNCTDEDSDGYCVTSDCDDSVDTCTTDCTTDTDSDGTYDCADTCLDGDGDGYGDAGGAGNTCTAADCDDESTIALLHDGSPVTLPGARSSDPLHARAAAACPSRSSAEAITAVLSASRAAASRSIS